MPIDKDFVFSQLTELQHEGGGYFGSDITDLAQQIGVTPFGLRKQITRWTRAEPHRWNFTRIGKSRPTITLEEFTEIKARRRANPVEKKTHILSHIQTQRSLSDRGSLPKTTFYRQTRQIELEMFERVSQFRWFQEHGITIPADYESRPERTRINELFTYSGLQTPQGPNLMAFCERFQTARALYDNYQVDPMHFYPQILTRNSNLRGLLTTIPTPQQEEIQAKIIFKIQTAFLVECKDFIISLTIQGLGRAQQSMNASRQKAQNIRRKEALKTNRTELREMIDSEKINLEQLKHFAYPLIPEVVVATMDLLRQKENEFDRLWSALCCLTNNMRTGVTFHPKKAKNVEHTQRICDLACDQANWACWNQEEKRGFIRDPDLVEAIDLGNRDIARLKAIQRVIDYIKSGKITFDDSYLYQDVGARIQDFIGREPNAYLTHEILEELIQGRYNIDLEPFYGTMVTVKDDNLEEEPVPESWSNLSDVLREVSVYVRKQIPDWFDEHQRVFHEQTEGMFSMTYDESTYADYFYTSIGYIGRNARFREDDDFYHLRYFIKRYLSEASVLLEMRFIHRCFTALRGYDISAAIIDTMGIANRKKSVFATYHGRYHTIGIADLRAVGIDMKPMHSSNCCSTDSEAMNIVSVMDEIQRMSGDAVKIYTGDAHTVSRLSAGLAFLSHGVIAAGRIIHPPKRGLTKRAIKHLRTHIPLLNKIGSLLRNEPSLGRVFSKKKHIYVHGVNVHKLVYNLGILILSNVVNAPVPVDEVCNAVELTNYLKKKVRILEGSYTRVDHHSTGLWLKCAELIISVCGLYHLLHNWKGPHSPFSMSDIRLFIPA